MLLLSSSATDNALLPSARYLTAIHASNTQFSVIRVPKATVGMFGLSNASHPLFKTVIPWGQSVVVASNALFALPTQLVRSVVHSL